MGLLEDFDLLDVFSPCSHSACCWFLEIHSVEDACPPGPRARWADGWIWAGIPGMSMSLADPARRTRSVWNSLTVLGIAADFWEFLGNQLMGDHCKSDVPFKVTSGE